MLSFQLSILIVIIFFIIVFLLILDNRLKSINQLIKNANIQSLNDSNNSLQQNNLNTQQIHYDPIKYYDEEKLTDPFEAPAKRPERIQMGYPPIMKSSTNSLQPYPTRGYPDNYHLLGTLISIDTNKDYNKLEQDNQIINLFGRQKYPGSSEYEYYTMISTGNINTKIPLKDQVRELFTDDEVFIKELNKTYKVNLYPNEELKYNPFLI